jgi:hypothetical protein
MADQKISQMPDAAVPLDGSELIPIVQSGVNKKVASSNVISSYLNSVSLSTTGNISATSGFIFASGDITLTLPSAIGLNGKTIYVKNVGTGVININTTGSETIDGQSSLPIEFQNTVVGFISDNTNWYIF